MPDSDRSHEHAHAGWHDHEALCNCAFGYQRASQDLGHLRDAEPDSPLVLALKGQRQACSERLLGLLDGDLMNIAGQWADVSSMAFEMKHDPSYRTRRRIKEKLKEIAFTGILEALPNLEIDPNDNLRSYLTTIGRRTLQKLHVRTARRRRHEHDRSMESTDTEAANDFADPAYDEQYERDIRAMMAESCVKTVYEYWKLKLNAENWKLIIIWLRGIPPTDDEIAQLQRSDPAPDPEEWRTMANWLLNRTKRMGQEIAEMMGPGWTEEQVRTRIHRIVKKTREYLRGRGYVEFTESREVKMDKHTIAILRKPAARKFWEQNNRRIGRQIIRWCIEEDDAPTYQELAERLGPGWKAGKVRRLANQVVDDTWAELRATGEIEA
jgi:DNA-directed RNA polymerase specialized sigma24 family protein